MKFGICNEIYEGWKLENVFKHAASVGYDVVEIAPFTLAPLITDVNTNERQRIREAAERTGISISGLHWVLAHTTGFHLTTPDASVRRDTSRYLVDLVNCCADLGGSRMIVGSPKQRSLSENQNQEQAWKNALEVFKDAVECAEDQDVIICIEPLGPSETDFINTAEAGRRFAAEFSSKAMSVILDVKAMCTEAISIPQIIQESAGQFAYFHANDRNLKGPGFGDVDFHPIAKALRAAGYDGTVSVEVFNFEEGPEAIASRSIEYLQQVFRSGD